MKESPGDRCNVLIIGISDAAHIWRGEGTEKVILSKYFNVCLLIEACLG